MKYLFLTILIMMMGVNIAHAQPKRHMIFDLFGPLEWDKQHWRGQDFKPHITDYQNRLPAAPYYDDRVLVKQTDNLSPTEFMARLKEANIITRVYTENVNFTHTGRSVAEVGQNFYALSQTDQNRVAKLLHASYANDTYVLRDKMSRIIVGVINDQGLYLY